MRRLTTLLPALLIAASVAIPAAAAPGGNGNGRGVAAAAENHVEAGYWNASRRAGAIDRDVLVREVGQGKPDKPGKPGGGGGGGGNGGGKGKPPKGDPNAVTGAPWTGGGLVQATVGKVYFTLGGTNYVCSGTAVDSTSGDLVLTAGHCVYDEAVGYATNFIFVPDHDPDGASYGQWPATQLITTTGWQNGDFNFDAAFAVIGEQNGQSLTDVVGGQSIEFNRARGEALFSFGYPAANPYSGGDLIHCAGTVTDDPYGATTQGMTCDMTGGSSGGGWMASFDTGTGAGVLTSVNSYKYGANGSVMYGPYFGTTIQNLFTSAEGLAA